MQNKTSLKKVDFQILVAAAGILHWMNKLKRNKISYDCVHTCRVQTMRVQKLCMSILNFLEEITCITHRRYETRKNMTRHYYCLWIEEIARFVKMARIPRRILQICLFGISSNLSAVLENKNDECINGKSISREVLSCHIRI